ncbi:hypothetical protein WJS89_01825 [Sphingomicrobium sp. XHP0235]|uniref:hypothetical protein n=1 Tax=Sphingomicrobium aquimarinum TaxID=3133971 RepID=UPI0031FEC35F
MMDPSYLPVFENAYLEDSYLLGFMAEGTDLRLKVLFALTQDHPLHENPKPGEAHCYREGYLIIEHPMEIQTKPARTFLTTDPDGSIDLGSIELHRLAEGNYLLVTEWFEASFKSEKLSIEVSQR